MWIFVLFVSFEISLTYTQNSRRIERQPENNGHGWDIRLAVPGEPGSDYPTLGLIPRTSFSCAGKKPGYYADSEANCQVFRVCTVGSTYGFQSFLCPNGTLFNQAVFVCDWWMNVNCGKSEQFFNKNNERFGNLRLGPQLMKDIKNMLTHSMLHPYDQTSMKNSFVVMQEYKAPSGQLIPNEALLAGPEKTPSNVYIPTRQKSLFYNSKLTSANDIELSATAYPSFSATVYNFMQQPTRNMNTKINNDNLYYKTKKEQKILSYSHNGALTESEYKQQANPTITQTFSNRGNARFNSNELQNLPSPNLITRDTSNISNPTQSLDSKKNMQSNINLKINQNAKLKNGPYVYNTAFPPLPYEINRVNDKLKENLVSKSMMMPKIIRKTFTLNKILEEQRPNNQPKSRITFKTWIIKPSKAARTIVEPQLLPPYSYYKPNSTVKDNLIQTTPFIIPKTTMSSQIETNMSELESRVNRPTVTSNANIITEPHKSYLAPTFKSNLSRQLLFTPAFVSPTKMSDINFTPTTFKPHAKMYIPPNETSVSRQLFSSNSTQPTSPPQNAKLQLDQNLLDYNVTANTRKPSFSFVKHSRVNAVHNNLTFADILTKEKLDITVNEIVKDTNKVLKSTPSQYVTHIHQKTNISNNVQDELGQRINIQKPSSSAITKLSQLVLAPATELTPPLENSNSPINNRVSNLPYIVESPLTRNTIERTISLKVSIPEKVADYLFKTKNDSDFDKLEILNTGSSNYLVLANKFRNNNPNYISLGKIVVDNEPKFSHSQALVFSFLADSLNAAKEYNNILQQNTDLVQNKQQLYKDTDDITSITSKISRLTSAQYSNIKELNNTNDVSQSSDQAIKKENINNNITDGNNIQNSKQKQEFNNNTIPTFQTTQQTLELTEDNTNNEYKKLGIDSKSNQIYSGQLYQLPVPDVTNNINNDENLAKLIWSNKILQKHTEVVDLQRDQTDVIDEENNNGLLEQPKLESEIMKTRQQLTVPKPAKLQLPSTKAPVSFSDTENQELIINNILNNENGISAHFQDKIFGTLAHPIEKNTLVSYEKDQSYYVFTKFDNKILQNNDGYSTTFEETDTSNSQNSTLPQNSINDNFVGFEFRPSNDYQEVDKKRQNIISVSESNESDDLEDSAIKKAGYLLQRPDTNNIENILTTDVNYFIEHPTSATEINERHKDRSLYKGPSSYLAPQASVGNLQTKQNFNSKLELFEENGMNVNNGYSKMIPTNPFYY